LSIPPIPSLLTLGWFSPNAYDEQATVISLTVDIKQKLVKEVAEIICDAYLIPDTRVFLREWPSEQTNIDGELARPMHPICNFCVPPGLPVEAKRQLVKRVSSPIAETCNPLREDVRLPSGKKVSTRWVLTGHMRLQYLQVAIHE